MIRTLEDWFRKNSFRGNRGKDIIKEIVQEDFLELKNIIFYIAETH